MAHDVATPAGPDLGRFSLEGRTAVITGASKNIGAALAAGFAQAGADVLMVARGAELLESVAGDIREASGRRVETLVADVAEPGTAIAVAALAGEMGSASILVNNAFSAGPSQGPVLETDAAGWDEVLGVNLLAPVRLCQAMAPVIEAAGGGSIINVVSGSGFLPTPGLGAYGVSKAALWMLTRYLAVEMAPHTRVNALCPGITTPDGTATHEVFEKLLPLVPMGRLGRPDEMVGAAIYLASGAASYTTGEIVFANGGRPW